jgi:nucleotidyltransferase/DNA polymerase involved in DNA repair
MTSHYAACPFCRRTFEHDGNAARVILDGVARRVCAECVTRLTPAASALPTLPKPNGELNGGAQ